MFSMLDTSKFSRTRVVKVHTTFNHVEQWSDLHAFLSSAEFRIS